jgi:hypothetical protein
VGVALVVGGFAGSEFAGSTRAATSTPVPAFTPTPGWTTVETSDHPPVPNTPDPIAWAANVAFTAQDLVTAWPHAPLQNLPPDGIVISVVGPSEGPFDKQARIVKPPYRVEDMIFWDSAARAARALGPGADIYQGQPSPNVLPSRLEGDGGDAVESDAPGDLLVVDVERRGGRGLAPGERRAASHPSPTLSLGKDA